MSTVPNFLDFTINAVLHPTFIRKLCYKLSIVVTFTFIQIFLSKLCLFLLNGIRVAAFAWYSVKIRVIFDVRFERRNVDKKANLHGNWNMQTLFWRLLNISAKFHQNWSLQFWAIPFQSWCVFLRHSVVQVLSGTSFLHAIEHSCSIPWRNCPARDTDRATWLAAELFWCKKL